MGDITPADPVVLRTLAPECRARNVSSGMGLKSMARSSDLRACCFLEVQVRYRSFCVSDRHTRWVLPVIIFASLLALVGADIATSCQSHPVTSPSSAAILPIQDHMGVWLGWGDDDLPAAATMRGAGAT